MAIPAQRIHLPICAICKKGVDKITVHYDPARNGTEVVLECHGEKEVGFLNYWEMITADSIGIVAFGTKKLHAAA